MEHSEKGGKGEKSGKGKIRRQVLLATRDSFDKLPETSSGQAG